jgi:hypothetical protein
METVAVSSVEKLSGYGPVGLACAFLVLAVVYLVRRNEKQEERHGLENKAQSEQHRLELKAEREKLETLYNRYAADAKEWADQCDEIAAKVSAAVDSMLRAKRGG